jgi:hypothetical protein
VTQDETWVRTADGWKLSFVANVRDGETWIDGERFEPAAPQPTTTPSTTTTTRAAPR